jgi:TolB-like protein
MEQEQPVRVGRRLAAIDRFKGLFVIARNSSFTYKGKAVDINQVGSELGVRRGLGLFVHHILGW